MNKITLISRQPKKQAVSLRILDKLSICPFSDLSYEDDWLFQQIGKVE